VHETAIVEPDAVVGAGTRVWHHAHVRSGARVGAGCVLGKGVYVDRGAVIGDRVKVQNNVSIFDGVTIEDDVFVGPGATFTNDKQPRAFSTDWTVVPTTVRAGASIGANATVVCGVEIGGYAMVAAGAVVTRDVAAHEVVAGNPAATLGWVCRCGRVVSRDQTAPADLQCEGCAADAGAGT
jgi:UDP-2-acetamido-3-amino-2,3-dideoxy-glucuronate N-acetyltransferase